MTPTEVAPFVIVFLLGGLLWLKRDPFLRMMGRPETDGIYIILGTVLCLLAIGLYYVVPGPVPVPVPTKAPPTPTRGPTKAPLTTQGGTQIFWYIGGGISVILVIALLASMMGGGKGEFKDAKQAMGKDTKQAMGGGKGEFKDAKQAELAELRDLRNLELMDLIQQDRQDYQAFEDAKEEEEHLIDELDELKRKEEQLIDRLFDAYLGMLVKHEARMKRNQEKKMTNKESK